MSFRLFLDATEDAPNNHQDWVIVRSVHDTCVQFMAGYMHDVRPEFISLPLSGIGDNEPNVHHLLDWLVQMDRKYTGFIHPRFVKRFHGKRTADQENFNDPLSKYLEERKNLRYTLYGSAWKEHA
jgi:hypothetical protein